MDLINQINRFLSRHLTPAVKTIFLINVGVFLTIQILWSFAPELKFRFVELAWEDPQVSLRRFRIWQFLTYMFVHEQGFHILFNMIILWFFSPELEHRWGTRRFWAFYLITGIGAGFFHSAVGMISTRDVLPIIGASGAIYGVMLAYAAYFPNRTVLVWGILPVLMKYLIAFIVIMDLMMLRADDGVSHFTHLAGGVVAFAYLARYHRTTDVTRWRYLR